VTKLGSWFVRTSMLYLITGFTLGLLLLVNKGVPISPALWRLLPAHTEFLLFGWTLQLAIGIAFWILPRFGTRRGAVWLAVLAYGLLNTGIWLTVTGYACSGCSALIAGGRTLEACAVFAFTLHAWPRIKPPGA
jgi:cbb3-type cytochrome oxidase subunit 1